MLFYNGFENDIAISAFIAYKCSIRNGRNINLEAEKWYSKQLECGPMPNLMVALPNIGGALCSTPESLADAHY